MKIISVVAARPNFMKIGPFVHAINEYNSNNNNTIQHILVHTGQHYDDRMSETFFEELNIPKADINLGVGSGSHAEQVGRTMIEFEKVLIEQQPDWVVVVGDVNATLACSVTAKKLNIKCCHIEAGLRSGDMTMPEEINRLVTDRLSDLLLTPDKMSIDNLLKEGVEPNRIKFVGNIMIDTLEMNRHRAADFTLNNVVKDNILVQKPFEIAAEKYAVVTLHRPSNVDNKEIFEHLINFLVNEVCKDMAVIWPIHPRAEKQLKTFGLWDKVIQANNFILTHPLGYLEMLRLNMEAKIMLTDSGGLQEECTVLGTPCLTLRWNTERPVTLKEYGGVSILVGNNIERIRTEYLNILKSNRDARRPELWDGKTAQRIVNELVNFS
jgi:UDP-N-acetylglucosamine 2-epimerase (non-hydrolysing)